MWNDPHTKDTKIKKKEEEAEEEEEEEFDEEEDSWASSLMHWNLSIYREVPYRRISRKKINNFFS